jgi:hypothetical protein
MCRQDSELKGRKRFSNLMRLELSLYKLPAELHVKGTTQKELGSFVQQSCFIQVHYLSKKKESRL